MLIVDTSKYKSIDQALKAYKNKHSKVKLIQELRERKTFTKSSVKRREEILKASYIESKRER